MQKPKIIIQFAVDKQDKRFAGFVEAENAMDLTKQLNKHNLEGYGLAFNKDGVNQGNWPKKDKIWNNKPNYNEGEI